jgi:tRNA pseudouridine55 synthase
MNSSAEGIFLVNKPKGKTSFSLVGMLRRHLGVKKIGHAGTLDPFATGVMVMLIGKKFTSLSDSFLNDDKEYVAEVKLGVATDSYDCDGVVTGESDLVPTEEAVFAAIANFQGKVMQTPPMFSAKKQNGKKLYELARKGEIVDRPAVPVEIHTTILKYEYPYLILHVKCSKGTYIRSIANDLGIQLGCGAHLTNLERTRSGNFHIDQCFDGTLLDGNQIGKATILERLLSR